MRKRIIAISRAIVGKTLETACKIAAENDATLRVIDSITEQVISECNDCRTEVIDVIVENGIVARVVRVK